MQEFETSWWGRRVFLDTQGIAADNNQDSTVKRTISKAPG